VKFKDILRKEIQKLQPVELKPERCIDCGLFDGSTDLPILRCPAHRKITPKIGYKKWVAWIMSPRIDHNEKCPAFERQ